MPIRVLVVGCEPLYSRGLEVVLADFPGVESCRTAADRETALDLLRTQEPHLLVFDILEPHVEDCLDLIREVRSRCAEINVLALCGETSSAFFQRAFATGATGCLTRRCDVDELRSAFETVARGQQYIPTSDIGIPIGDRPHGTSTNQDEPLSTKEVLILQLVAEGLTSKQIASRLGRSVRTVHAHRQNIMRKLDIHTASGLVRYAISSGLAPPVK